MLLLQSLRALYLANGGSAVEPTEKEPVRLNEGEMANDSVIDFFLKWGVTTHSLCTLENGGMSSVTECDS